MEPLLVCHCRIQFNLGVQFRLTDKPLPESLSARYLRMEAAPPYRRVDGSPWPSGLRVVGLNGGADLDFNPDVRNWVDPGVFPLEGIAPLGLPEPETLVVDQWVTVPPVPEKTKVQPTIALGNVDDVPHFVSVAYPPPGLGGKQLDEVGFYYYLPKAVVRFTREASDWIAVSFDRFWPPERSSADYILEVADCPENDDHQDALRQLRERATADAVG